MAFQYRDDWYQFAPPWLRTDVAERYMYTCELMRDLLLEKADQAVRIRIPGAGDISQLPYLAHDRQLVQGPNESDADFLVRLEGAFDAWAECGSAAAVLGQLQAYTQGFQPDADPAYPIMRIVSNLRGRSSSLMNTWHTVLAGDAIGQRPAMFTQRTASKWFRWDARDDTWRSWIILYQHPVEASFLSPVDIDSAAGGSFTEPGELVDGVWVPTTSGTPVNAPFLTVSGLSGLTSDDVGAVLTLSGGDPANEGTWQIVQVLSATACVIANPDGVAPDTGLSCTIGRYPWIPPGLAWGSPDTVWGQGEEAIPEVDTGSNRQGCWKPTALAGVGSSPSYSWGLRISSLVIDTVRGLVRKWKAGASYFPHIIVAYDGGDGFGSSAYSPYTTNNPGTTFGEVGALDTGVWVPTRKLTSPWDAFCQGTGQALACGVENIT